jgi:hypothetical protein
MGFTPENLSPRKARLLSVRDDPEYAEPVLDVRTEELREYRCTKCDRLLFKARLTAGSAVEIMCHNKWCRDRKRKALFSMA